MQLKIGYNRISETQLNQNPEHVLPKITNTLIFKQFFKV